MDELMQCFVEGPIRITQYAAWPMSDIAKKHPQMLLKYYPIFIDLLNQKNKPDAINRNILRALQFVILPEEHEGAILDVSFKQPILFDELEVKASIKNITNSEVLIEQGGRMVKKYKPGSSLKLALTYNF